MSTYANDETGAATLPDLASELLRRQDEDQRARTALIPVVRRAREQQRVKANPDERQATDEVVRIDQANTQWLKHVVERHGWPGQSLVGRHGAAAAWLLVQHADRDPSFQRRCLDLMTAMPPGEVMPHHIAYLTDRVLLAEGAPQLYGTQIQQVDGVYQPSNLANPENVDQRRAAVGLQPLAEYLRHFLDDCT
ncbi:MAG: DUF6624 domain-containing protein [Pseudonocardiaceae bacterium]